MLNRKLYNYHWDDFERSIKTTWQNIQTDEDMCDVTIACDDNQMEVHKIVVSSCSPVLKNILKQAKNQHPFIYLRGVKYKDLQNLINFIYQGEVSVDGEDLHSFLDVAEDLQIKGMLGKSKEKYYFKKDTSKVRKKKFPSLKRERYTQNTDKPSNINQSSEVIPKYNKSSEVVHNCDESSEVVHHYDESSRAVRKYVESSGVVHKYDETSNIIQESDKSSANEIDGTRSGSLLPKFVFMEESEATVVPKVDFDTCKNSEHEDIIEDDQDNIKIEHENYLNVEAEDYISNFVPVNGEKPLICGLCDKQYASKRGLLDHRLTIHEQAFNYSCHYKPCDYKAIKKSFIRVHIEAIHEGIRYSCDKCNYKANKKSNLRRHVEKKQCKNGQ